MQKQQIREKLPKNSSLEDNPLKIVRDFQKKYRESKTNAPDITYKWEANPSSSVELTQKNYAPDSQ